MRELLRRAHAKPDGVLRQRPPTASIAVRALRVEVRERALNGEPLSTIAAALNLPRFRVAQLHDEAIAMERLRRAPINGPERFYYQERFGEDVLNR